MRRVVLPFAIATFAVACSTPTPSPASPSPFVADTPALTSAPSRVPVPDATATLTPTATPIEVIPDESVAPPLEVDFNAAPTFPSPVLVVGSARARAIGESGCPQIIYEPADDAMGRGTGMQAACITEPGLAFSEPVRVASGAPLAFRAPKGWLLGAQVIFPTDPSGPFWIIEATRLSARPGGATPLVSVSGDGWVEIGRGDGYRLDEIDAPAPTEPGDYVVAVQSQVGQAPAKWRTYDRTYYYWIQVS